MFIISFSLGWQHCSDFLLKLIEDVYRWLPLGTLVNNKVLVVHGGISDNTDLDWVKNLSRSKVSPTYILVGFQNAAQKRLQPSRSNSRVVHFYQPQTCIGSSVQFIEFQVYQKKKRLKKNWEKNFFF